MLVGSELQFDPCPLIREGMMVEVVHGPLRGVIGRLMRKDAQRARLVLSVDLIGQAVSVEVDAADVKPCCKTFSGDDEKAAQGTPQSPRCSPDLAFRFFWS